MYGYYNPGQAAANRAASMDRLMMLLDARRAEEEMDAQIAKEQEAAFNNMGGAWGSAGQGAMIGGMAGGWPGALIGGVGGFAIGGLVEAKKRQNMQKEMGNSGYSFWDGMGDSYGRLPTTSEFEGMMGQGGQLAAMQANKHAAAAKSKAVTDNMMRNTSLKTAPPSIAAAPGMSAAAANYTSMGYDPYALNLKSGPSR
jgi:hypothetical protein